MSGRSNETFGTRLRELRERTRPEEIGLPVSSRRRVRGLRREELAAFADVSVDYLTRLEQGSAKHPSVEVTAAIARALRLPRLERDLLHHLAGHTPPSDQVVPRHLGPGVHRLLERFDGVPVAVYDPTWTLLTANDAWRALRGAGASSPGYSLIEEAFGEDPPDKRNAEYHERLRRALVADLRITAARYPLDQRLRQMLGQLLDTSLAFAAEWAEARAQYFESEPKMFVDATFGKVWLDCDVLTSFEGDTRIVMYTAAPGTTGDAFLRSLTSQSPGHRQ
jgi:transcriptional regulator with XRE-family HTH domain